VRYVNLGGSGGPVDAAWIAKAIELKNQLIAAPDKAARDALIDANGAMWGQLRNWLLSLSHDKCWYSEARDLFSVLEVEHYRPKKRCKRAPRGAIGDGYWWLAFDWKNYRLCGKVGNAKKGDFFPLATGSFVAAHGGISIDNELPLLLDPACPGDPDLLTFNEDGTCGPHADADAATQLRVKTTTTRINLNHGRIAKGRQRIWKRCIDIIEDCRNLAMQLSVAPAPAEQARLILKKEELRTMVRPEAEFSAVAKACLLKSNIGWAAALATG
jgi:hypothetical protein